jgi:hypothetical protein
LGVGAVLLLTVEPPSVGDFNDGTGNLSNTPRWIRPAKCAVMARATVACRTSSPTSMFRCSASQLSRSCLSHLARMSNSRASRPAGSEKIRYAPRALPDEDDIVNIGAKRRRDVA